MTVNVITLLKANRQIFSPLDEILNSLKRYLPKVEGCRDIKIFRSVNDRHTFVLMEVWDSEAQQKKYFANVQNSNNWKHLLAHLRCEPEVNYCLEY